MPFHVLGSRLAGADVATSLAFDGISMQSQSWYDRTRVGRYAKVAEIVVEVIELRVDTILKGLSIFNRGVISMFCREVLQNAPWLQAVMMM
jgi:hypothetical protein